MTTVTHELREVLHRVPDLACPGCGGLSLWKCRIREYSGWVYEAHVCVNSACEWIGSIEADNMYYKDRYAISRQVAEHAAKE